VSEVQPFDTAETDRLLSTTKAVRRRLDLNRPVPRELIVECIQLSRYAPNASNAQEWKWIVVDDPDLRKVVGEQYRKLTVPSVSQMMETKLAQGDERGARISSSIIYLAEHMHEVPALVFPCYDIGAAEGRYETLLGSLYQPSDELQMSSGMYASIYPAVWSFQLACRSRGLGTVLTTAHQLDQPAMADILGIPHTWDQTCMIPVAYTTGGDFVPSPRRPVDDDIIWNLGEI
jgi:nitroreductase